MGLSRPVMGLLYLYLYLFFLLLCFILYILLLNIIKIVTLNKGPLRFYYIFLYKIFILTFLMMT
jgi:hypothetical protein